jgi:hypothetical protein
MTESTTNIVSINGTDHDIDTFSDEQKGIINQLRLCQTKIAQIKAELNIVEVSQQAYTDALIQSVEASKENKEAS